MIYFSDFDAGTVSFVPEAADFSITIGTPTASDASESMLMSCSSGTGTVTQIHGLMRTLPAGDFSVIVKLHNQFTDNNNNAGIIFRDTGNKFVSIVNMAFTIGTIPLSVVEEWSSRTVQTGNLTARNHGRHSPPLWLKASFNSATNDVEGFYSFTRDNWQSLGTSTYLGTADAVGIATVLNYAAVGTVENRAWFEHFEVI